MSVRARLAAAIAGKPPAAPPSIAARSIAATIAPTYAGRPQWLQHVPENYRREALEKIALIFRCIQFTANAAGHSGVTLRVYDDLPDDSRKAVPNHPLRLLMRQPNPRMREGRFLTFITMVATASSFCVIEKVRSPAGRVVALEPLMSEWLRPILRDQANCDWEYTIPGISPAFTIKAEESIVFTYADRPNARLHPTGYGPVEACFREVGLLNVMTDFLKVFFDRGAMPVYGAITDAIPGMPAMSQADKDQMAEAFVARHGGLDKAGMPIILEGVKDIKRLSFDFDELALTDIRDMSDIAICQAFGIDPGLVGTRVGMEHSDARANATEASRKFYRDVMIPLWNRLDEALSLDLLPEFEPFGTTRELAFDYSDVQALQQDRNAKSNWVVAAFTAGALSQHMLLDEMGMAIPTTPDFYSRSIANEAVPVDDPLETKAPTPTPPAKPAPPATPMATVRMEKQAAVYGDRPRIQFRRTFQANGGAEMTMEHPGLFVGMFLPPDQANQLALENGEPADILHMTLAYDENAALDDLGFAHAVATIDDACGGCQPLSGAVQGHGRFYGGSAADAQDVFYAVPNLPALGDMRGALMTALRSLGLAAVEEHSFTPHVTLAYLDAATPDPVDHLAAIPLALGGITVSFGGENVVVPLRGDQLGKPMPAMTPMAALGRRGPSERLAFRDTSKRQIAAIAKARQPSIQRFLGEQRDRFAAAIEQGRVLTIASHDRPLYEHLALPEFDWAGEDARLAKVMKSLYVLSGQTAYAQTSAHLGASISFDLANPRVRNTMDKLALRVKDINQTTRDDIADIVTQAQTDGVDRGEMANRLRGLYDETYAGRSETIARTESMTSYGYASASAYRESGVVDRIQCFDNPDHTADYGAEDGLSCSERDGLIDDLDTAELHIDSEHPNGSLAISPVLAGED